MEVIIDYFSQPQNGILGILVLICIFVILWQQKRIDNKDKLITDLLNKQIDQANQFTDGYVSTTKDMVGIQKDNLNALNLLQRSVDTIATSLQNLVNNK